MTVDKKYYSILRECVIFLSIKAKEADGMTNVCVLPTDRVKAVRTEIAKKFSARPHVQKRVLAGFDFAIAGQKREAARAFFRVPIADLADVLVYCRRSGVNLHLR